MFVVLKLLVFFLNIKFFIFFGGSLNKFFCVVCWFFKNGMGLLFFSMLGFLKFWLFWLNCLNDLERLVILEWFLGLMNLFLEIGVFFDVELLLWFLEEMLDGIFWGMLDNYFGVFFLSVLMLFCLFGGLLCRLGSLFFIICWLLIGVLFKLFERKGLNGGLNWFWIIFIWFGKFVFVFVWNIFIWFGMFVNIGFEMVF